MRILINILVCALLPLALLALFSFGPFAKRPE